MRFTPVGRSTRSLFCQQMSADSPSPRPDSPRLQAAQARRSLFGALLVALAVPALLGGCVSKKTGTERGSGAGTSGTAPAPVADAQLEAFDESNFGASTPITNPWAPLTPGTHMVYEGITVEDDGTKVPHRFESYVTDLTKTIGGIRAVVVWDLDYSDGELAEAELAFFAQDKDGNVWRMGEYPEEYDEGKIVAHPSWIHGLEGAQAGIEMRAAPALGTPSYSQGWGPAVQWTDRAQVDQMGQKTCVPVDCYEGVLVVAETSQSEKDAHQLKYYARGVGSVRVGWRGAGEKTKETLELTKLERLDAKGLAEARAKALELERSAYKNSPGLYGRTPPAEPPSGS